MREVQRHNFEFIRTEILHLSIEEFADKIGVSKSSYQRMKSENYDAEYYISPVQKACELADVSLDIFVKQYLTKELYKNRHKKTQAIVLSKKQLLAFLLIGIFILNCVSLGMVLTQTTVAKQSPPLHTSLETKASTQSVQSSKELYYWTDSESGSYHANRNCPVIKNRNNIESGTLADGAKKKKFDPCDFCTLAG